MMQAFLPRLKRIVLKIGSSLLVSPTSGINRDYLDHLAEQVALLKEEGRELLLVSSGAIAAGMERLNLKERPSSISELQATAAVGQGFLMHLYEEAFERKNIKVAQVLLTHEDFRDRKRYLNARSTLLTLLSLGVVPIINENDSVAIEEIRLGDNDTLAALTAGLVEADLLVIFTDVEGFFVEGPEGKKLLSVVKGDFRELEAFAQGPGSKVGTGGMLTKLKAARLASRAGIPTLIVKGSDPKVLEKVLQGERLGTLFLPQSSKLTGKKRWIGLNVKPKGTLIVDQGAKEAILKRGKSLLPSGIKEVIGDFQRGDTVRLRDEEGQDFAQGLTNYSAKEIREVMGLKTYQIEGVLGYKYSDEVIHRDNLVLLE
jgi:glutamate 5-kinase